jgi:CBS-domain-containing membrane protein
MTQTVRDVMNAKLLYIRSGDPIGLARRHIINFGVTAIPVLDETHRPVGVVSLRDLAKDDGYRFEPVGVVATVPSTLSVEEGARRLAESGHHHLVVVDEKGVAVGMVSSLDFLRALVGLPVQHPKMFDRF